MIGILLILAGAVMTWIFSGILGAVMVVVGLLKLGLDLVTREPSVERPDYDRGQQTYTLYSHKPKSRRAT